MSEIKVNKVSPRSGTNTTLGNSGDTLTINCGVTLNNAGIITTTGISGSGTIINNGTITSSIEGVISWDTTAKTADFNALVGNGYFVDTTSSAITVTLPASPVAADLISLKDYANTASTNNIIINANGNKIQGSVTNFLINVDGTAANFIYVDATQGWVLIDASNAANINEEQLFIIATGGTVTCCGDYKIHTFTSPGTFTVTNAGAPVNANVDYLVVAGGGGGGTGNPDSNEGGAGAGAGGYRESSGTASGCYTRSPLGVGVSALPVTVQGYPITVGAGGAAATPAGANVRGASGNPSVFSTITSTGGGGGGSRTPGPVGNYVPGGPGGSGGGTNTAYPGTTVGAGNTPPVSPPQGNSGGTQKTGGSALGPTPATFASADGAYNDINLSTGESGPAGRYYASGGGSGGPPTAGTAGLGGGGNGGYDGVAAQSGTANTGGGGGGANRFLGPGPDVGGGGGSGIIIIRYKYQ